MSEDEKRQVEALVNADILDNAETSTRVMGLDEAKAAGAIGLFGEKYGEEVRVVAIGPTSVELCGGTHVARAGDIGMLLITSEAGIAQGVRRVEAVTGAGALQHVQHLGELVRDAAEQAGVQKPEDLHERIEKLQQELKERSRKVEVLQRQLATGGAGQADTVEEVEGIKLLAKRVPAADPKVMREAADNLRDRLGTGVVVLAGERDGKANVLVAVTKDLKGKVHAGKLVGALAAHVDGRGGGRPDLAQAGGPKVAGLDDAVQGAREALRAQLAER
jgi:alanyl-tRNA synthetase